MSEAYVSVQAGDVSLEALHEPGKSGAGAVLCHPHPLYGGDMGNNVVSALQAALSGLGWGTLRFNFRGVGRSGGTYGEGVAEAADVAAAAAYLAGRGTQAVHLAGYSFGAWVVLKAIREGFRPESTTLVSPPLDLLDFSGLIPPPAPCLIVVGDRDDFCAADSLKKWLASRPDSAEAPVVEILARCDHFYRGKENLLREKVSGFVRTHLPG
ncbi:MAG: alpha/beta hydrolase [Syntrophobacteraceae bacterium]|nr:hypothetical protein [Desulfobacteraceae bacterium]